MSQPSRPNILLILADDLGVGELGCYGQEQIRTPNLDRLAQQGARCTSAYSGSCVCAPTRASILTGRHTGHSAIRTNLEVQPEGQMPLPPSEVTFASRLREQGYATALVGKWGLGPPGGEGAPSRHGFDLFYGYLCQRHAHDHRPGYLYRNETREPLEPGTYAPDRFLEEAIGFVRRSAPEPFLLCYHTTIPHVALQVPDDSLAEYAGAFQETPYDGTKGYTKHPTPRAAYAAMVTRMDRDVGILLAELDRLGLAEETIVVFASDNGPTWAGGTDSTFFESADGRRGLKGQLYEGGIRVPLIVRWPGHITPGLVRDEPVGLWDLAPTFEAAMGAAPNSTQSTPGGAVDGIDLSAWLGARAPLPDRVLYWEYPSEGGWQAIRWGRWKAIRKGVAKRSDAPIELYDLLDDPGESKDVASEHPEVVADLRERMQKSRTDAPVPEWNIFP
ncbi:MAG: arylsulfatase [Phycisphaerae bacterium]|nr:arylsulfatase [Phycisphaerae bacterium]